MKDKLAFVGLAGSFVVFGTVGLFRRAIPLGSATLAAARGFLGVLTLLVVMLITKKRFDFAAIRKNLLLLLLSGAAIGINWIFLFEAYNRTTVAVATLCYYTAPIFALIAAPFVFREKFTLKALIAVLLATAGMAGVSGVLGGGAAGGDVAGILLGLAAAVFYAAVNLMNKKIRDVDAYDKTVVQLLTAAVVVLPYALFTEQIPSEAFAPKPLIFLLLLGILHTGLSYAVYFGALPRFSVGTASFLGYIDPVVAVLLSATVLGEPLETMTLVGIVCVLGATVFYELPIGEGKRQR